MIYGGCLLVNFTSDPTKYSQTIFTRPQISLWAVKISWYLTSSGATDRVSGRVCVDWHAIRCLSHYPAARHAREPVLRAKMSICPPERRESSPPWKLISAQPVPLRLELLLRQTENSCLQSAVSLRDYRFIREMSHLRHFTRADTAQDWCTTQPGSTVIHPRESTAKPQLEGTTHYLDLHKIRMQCKYHLLRTRIEQKLSRRGSQTEKAGSIAPV